jgi:hypothetical protein
MKGCAERVGAAQIRSGCVLVCKDLRCSRHTTCSGRLVGRHIGLVDRYINGGYCTVFLSSFTIAACLKMQQW